MTKGGEPGLNPVFGSSAPKTPKICAHGFRNMIACWIGSDSALSSHFTPRASDSRRVEYFRWMGELVIDTHRDCLVDGGRRQFDGGFAT